MKKIFKYVKICKKKLTYFIQLLSERRYPTFVKVGKFNLEKNKHLHINLSRSVSPSNL